jgi:hypothetical protein
MTPEQTDELIRFVQATSGVLVELSAGSDGEWYCRNGICSGHGVFAKDMQHSPACIVGITIGEGA